MEKTSKEMVIDIVKDISVERLAVMMDRSLATINKWKYGKSQPSKGDLYLLKEIHKKGATK